MLDLVRQIMLNVCWILDGVFGGLFRMLCVGVVFWVLCFRYCILHDVFWVLGSGCCVLSIVLEIVFGCCVLDVVFLILCFG